MFLNIKRSLGDYFINPKNIESVDLKIASGGKIQKEPHLYISIKLDHGGTIVMEPEEYYSMLQESFNEIAGLIKISDIQKNELNQLGSDTNSN